METIKFEKEYKPGIEMYLNVFGKRIPLEFTKQMLQSVFICVLLIYTFETGRSISNDYAKMAAYFCPSGADMNGQIQKCYPSQVGTSIIWNCSAYQKQSIGVPDYYKIYNS